MQATLSPRIYVADLASYNAGRLVGAWIDAAQDVDTLRAEAEAVLEPGHEEIAIHDYDGFGSIRLGEYEDLGTVSALALALEEHGPALAAFYANDPSRDVDELVSDFEEAFAGEWDNEEAFAQNYAEDTFPFPKDSEAAQVVDMWPFTCIDWERAANDLFSGDYWSADSGSGVYVFRSI